MIVPDGWLTVKEAAAMLGISTGRLYQLIRDGFIEARRPRWSSRGIVLSRQSIETLVQGFVPVRPQL